MTSVIKHKGVVESVEGQRVIVRITQTSACGECQARGLCHASESKDKLVEVISESACDYSVGSVVTVAGSGSLGMKAVWLSFGLPLILLLAVLVTVISVAGREELAAVCSLVALLPYYVVLFLFRERLRDSFQFRIIQ